MRGVRFLAVGASGAVLGALLLPLTGLVNLDASSGHWGITDWFFHLAARQSVTLRSAAIEVPPLDSPAMARRGMEHYRLVCANCHGSPAGPPAQLARDLTPTPPFLMEQMQHWRPEARIFWTVKHGIKRTAMPAWPAQMRDDEVWDMVAFLQEMPDMAADEYAAAPFDPVTGLCAQCHGEEGRGQGSAFPRLDIQSPTYLAAALKAFRHGTRASGTMMAAASGLTDAQITALAQHYGQNVGTGAIGEGRGAEIARRGIPERDIAACDSCHGETARTGYPRLAGQHRDYIVNQLELFITLGPERGGPFADIMATAVKGLTPDEIEALADWYGVEAASE